MSIMDKLKKNSKLKNTEVLSESKFFNEKDMEQMLLAFGVGQHFGTGVIELQLQ